MYCRVKPYEGNEPFAFFSYCHKDAKTVYPIIESLASEGYRIWYDDGIHPGADWMEIIAEHIHKSALCIAAVSEDSVCSHNCRNEINFVIEHGQKLIPIILKNFPMSLGVKLQLSASQFIRKYEYSSEIAFYEKLYSAEGLDQCKGNVSLIDTTHGAAQETAEKQAAENREISQIERARSLLQGSVRLENERVSPMPQQAPVYSPQEQPRPTAPQAPVYAPQEQSRPAAPQAPFYVAQEQPRSMPQQAPVYAPQEQPRPAAPQAPFYVAQEQPRSMPQQAPVYVPQEQPRPTAPQVPVYAGAAGNVTEQRQNEAVPHVPSPAAVEIPKEIPFGVIPGEKPAFANRPAEAAQPAISDSLPEEDLDEKTEYGEHVSDYYDEDEATVMEERTVMVDRGRRHARNKDLPPAVLISLEDGQFFRIQNSTTKIGRDSAQDIVIPDKTIGRLHAEILFTAQGYYVRDADSVNGTLVDDKQIEGLQPVALGKMASISFAERDYVFLSEENAKAALETKKLAYLYCKETEETRYLEKQDFILGRSNAWSGGAMQDKRASRVHGKVVCRDDGIRCLEVNEKDTPNGTFLNGNLLAPGSTEELSSGDVIGVSHVYHIEYNELALKGE